MRCLFLFLFSFSACFLLTPTYAQSLSDSMELLLEQSDYWDVEEKHEYRTEKREEINEKILDLDCKTEELTDSIRALICYRLSLRYENSGKGTQALYYALSGLEYSRKHYGLINIRNILFLNRAAQTLDFHFGLFEEVLQKRKEIERIRKNNLLYDLSIKERIRFMENLIFMANVYMEMKDEKRFHSTFELIDELKQKEKYIDAYNPFEYALFKSYGYLAFGRAEEAFSIISPETVRQDSLLTFDVYSSLKLFFAQTVLMEVYLAQKKPNAALPLFRENTVLSKRYFNKQIMYEAYNTYIGAKALTILKEYEESEEILIDLIARLEEKGRLSNNTHLAELYEQLAKNQYHRAEDESNAALLYEAYNYNNKALQNLEIAWGNFKNQDDLKYSLNKYYQVFETSLLTLHTLYEQTDSLHYFEEALRLVELTNNVELRSSMKQSVIAKELGISSHLLERERTIQQQLFKLGYELDHTDDEKFQTTLKDSIHQINGDLIALQESIHRQYPNYTGQIHTQKGFTWNVLETHLKQEDQTLLYFSSGEENLFLLAASPNGYVFSKKEIGRDSLVTMIDNIRAITYASPDDLDGEKMDAFKLLSYELFETILAPATPISTSRLLVIPDGPLGILPFSMLLSSLPKEEALVKDWPFTIKNFSFSHAYALDLLLNPEEKVVTNYKEEILAFAPDFSMSLLRGNQTRAEGQLTDNKAEVSYIKDRFSTTAFLGSEARLPVFRENVSDFAVLHLATHAVANTAYGDYSYLVFSETDTSDHRLNVGELYTMDIPADLVVLSACETGLGEWQRGEGVIGLERAFSYAGAKSLVTTHWKVSDKASANLMGYFYDELAKGLPKDQALQNAQLSFIKEQDNWLAHPFFWAAYVQKGNTDPLSIPKKTSKWIWWLLGIGTFGGIFVMNKKQPFFNAN